MGVRHASHARPAQSGVTLIELLVALTILGVALAAVLPSVSDWLRGLAVRNAGESVRAGVEKARMEALRRNSPMAFWLVNDTSKTLSNGCVSSSSGPSWVVSVNSPEGKCDASPSTTDDPLLADKWSAADGSTGVVVQGVDANGTATDSVTFTSLGQVLAAGSQLARIDITHSTPGVRALRVLVLPGGSVRMCDPNVAADDPRKC